MLILHIFLMKTTMQLELKYSQGMLPWSVIYHYFDVGMLSYWDYCALNSEIVQNKHRFRKYMKFKGVCVVVCFWLRSISLAVKSLSCSWSSMLTRSTYLTGLWIAATQALTSLLQAASKPLLQSVAAGTKFHNLCIHFFNSSWCLVLVRKPY